MYKYYITFHFKNDDTKTFEYVDMNDLIFDLNYNLAEYNKQSIYWIIERINYE